MSMNIEQVYTNNPSTSLPLTALMYAGLSNFSAGDDTAITVGNFLLQIPSSTWVDVAGTPQALAANSGYVTDHGATKVVYTLPTTCSVGIILEVAGKSSGGWQITQSAGQNINLGNQTTSTGTGGSLSSSNQYDYVKLLCITANLQFLVIGAVGNLTFV
jgi:hypothetical protein